MLTLVNDRIGVIPIFDPDVSPGGIIIPEQAKERCDQGIVKYVGPKVKDIKIGDYVIFSGYTGTAIALEGEGRIFIMRERFVVCTIPEIENITINGIYFRSANGEYIPATFEQAMEVMARSFTEQRKALSVVSEKPRKEDYDDNF